MNELVQFALVALLAPAGAALLNVLIPPLRHRGMPAAIVALAGSLLSTACALRILLNPGGFYTSWTTTWLKASGRPIAEMGVHLDGVSVPMLLVVTLVATCVQIFSLGYMHDEKPRSFGRYFTLHALFLFAMNTLVLAPNLLQLFFGWELVGLASYLLIGFWFEKPSAARAAVKAFWMTKLGDMGFLFGLLWLFVAAGTFSWKAVVDPATATWVTALLFFAVVGKSAQFPLHIWLPDAMEGPTPVSALLHAATMVAAGVFLVVRADPLFAQAPATRELMLWVGATTAVFAACLAMVQQDIKKVLAYSTCSQLGYMVAALGAGSAFAGFFHLGTHAFFKALLFLAAGSVIHAVHSNLLSDMGGLRKKMWMTTLAFVVGAASLAGLPFLAGFYSKDMILTTLQEHGKWGPWVMLLFTAFLTAFYMTRVVVKAFWGPLSEKAAHAHEGGNALVGPLAVLVGPSILAGYLAPTLARYSEVELHFHVFEFALTPLLASAMSLSGVAAGIVIFGRGGTAPMAATLEALDAGSYVDKLWQAGYRQVLGALSGALGWFDRYVVDGLVNLSGYATIEAAEGTRRIQTGRVRDYAMFVAAGAMALIFWAVLR